MFSADVIPWLVFTLFVLGMLALDLGVFHRKAHAVSLREAAIWSAVWVALALAFNAGLFLVSGTEPGLQFLTGYIIEKSLSVDNIFVFVLIFSYFAVPPAYQHRVLFWGILGALVMRATFILVGSALLKEFHWVIYLFGGFLVVTGIRMILQRHETLELERNAVVRLARRFLPVTSTYDGPRFFTRVDGRLLLTPLFLVLLVVEATDLVFAVDSIPAIFAITEDPFIVYTSNIFAILGLRSLYFLLAGIVPKFYYLKPALSFILVFVGVKMLLTDVYKVPTLASLAVIAAVLGAAVVASVLRARRLPAAGPPQEAGISQADGVQ
ncbi:MAG TPA: TerC family protein [Dehalococcoidia bacterium]